MAGAKANGDFQLSEFMEAIANELIETGFIEGFELCHYRAQRGMRADGYWFNDEDALDLFVADFESRNELGSLTQMDVTAAFKRVANFYEASKDGGLHQEMEETSPEYGLARQISDRKDRIRRVNFFLFSEQVLSGRLQVIEDNEISSIPAAYHVWDISRLQRQRSSRGQKEALNLDIVDMFGEGLPCLPAHLGSETYPSYLVVMSGRLLANLYEKYGARLLEQNVRSFLQARGMVNKGIRSTILNEPKMFFAYNNGITATAQDVKVQASGEGLQITRIKDLQIVNGGQTTASLFHTARRDKVPLDGIFVQMKLSIIDNEDSETVVPRISEYANTQNRVNAADFFSNHPFHIRIEEFSRRIWAPAQQGAQHETKWFYERARGQYADAQSTLTPAKQRQFKAEHPKAQMFTKTDLAKFENVWDEHPRWVNLGAQKNFVQYAKRIGEAWSASSESFSEFYFRRAIARAIIFRHTEKLVSNQPWYNGGYRANIVAYALAAIGACCKRRERSVDYQRIWSDQRPPPSLLTAIAVAAKFVNEGVSRPPQGISNISEWCKKEACWQRLHSRLDELKTLLSEEFWEDLVSLEEENEEEKSAKKTQRIDDGIEAQKRVLEISSQAWGRILHEGQRKKIFSGKEIGILNVAKSIPSKIPTEKQSCVLLEILEKARSEGIQIETGGNVA